MMPVAVLALYKGRSRAALRRTEPRWSTQFAFVSLCRRYGRVRKVMGHANEVPIELPIAWDLASVMIARGSNVNSLTLLDAFLR